MVQLKHHILYVVSVERIFYILCPYIMRNKSWPVWLGIPPPPSLRCLNSLKPYESSMHMHYAAMRNNILAWFCLILNSGKFSLPSLKVYHALNPPLFVFTMHIFLASNCKCIIRIRYPETWFNGLLENSAPTIQVYIKPVPLCNELVIYSPFFILSDHWPSSTILSQLNIYIYLYCL